MSSWATIQKFINASEAKERAREIAAAQRKNPTYVVDYENRKPRTPLYNPPYGVGGIPKGGRRHGTKRRHGTNRRRVKHSTRRR